MRRSRSLLTVGCLLMGFLGGVALRSRPPSPESRLPRRYQLAAVIQRKQRDAAALRREAGDLRRRLAALQAAHAGRQQGEQAQVDQMQQSSLAAGLVAVRGPGLRVTLDDSEKAVSPSGNVNDLVVHSQDVQAVVNAAWKAGAEAVAINGQRLVGTSAVLCVGNTLLLNGTVQSPPYAVAAVGASRDRFEADRLVRRLHEEAKAFGLRFSVTRDDDLGAPAFKGVTDLRWARPAA